MLSRTADNLFWMARYVERADFLARILDAAQRFSALPSSFGAGTAEWGGVLASSGAAKAFYAKGAEANEDSVCRFLLFDPTNPSSVYSCLTNARNNGRAVRTALTSETWEALNGAWNELNGVSPDDALSDLGRFLEWVKTAALMFDGSARRTMLRNDAYWFLRLGAAVERADNTARILDVKYHLLLPQSEVVGGGLDYFQWTTILREVSALTAYRWVYQQSLQPSLVADLLILNRQMPRSLASCYEVTTRYLDLISDHYGRRGESQKRARAMTAKLSGLDIGAVFDQGLHEFIEDFLQEHGTLTQTITEQYLN
jgi:uncharacterized alpha-E superfamily protein